ncbi:maleylacetoacetate isomerase [Endozoicomonas sp. OPT23]|uniref:maleylacetoacetate isomerase n=1 Tax=Endozoicomonas sp. OPT23 TaxID=2072845 RepID=UPI00129B989C|nr:maleylacetoacetate isomerase [Endozoicomonas sp. OPT23]MRI34851.1 maleylacetoacetate isomerase [Endozoicomonas sp. OPT23]
MKLYSYYRSSAAYRVRIALNLKKLDYEIEGIDLLHGQQTSEQYQRINPQMLVPALEIDNQILIQSLAIIEYLEEEHPSVSLLPEAPVLRAKCRSLAYLLACDTHPLNNLRVLNYLTDPAQLSDEVKKNWYHHWLETSFQVLEKQLQGRQFCLGTSPTLADICLIPQVYNALRFDLDMSGFPKIMAIYEHCNQRTAFIKAHPDQQPDKPVLSTPA